MLIQKYTVGEKILEKTSLVAFAQLNLCQKKKKLSEKIPKKMFAKISFGVEEVITYNLDRVSS